MRSEIVQRLHKNFEDYVHAKDGVEFWFARDLQILLSYTQWRNFLNVIEKAKESCKNSNHAISDHFADGSKMVPLGSGSERQDLLQFYMDLSDIQKVLKVKLHVPDRITSEDRKTIQDIVALLRGKEQKIPEISGRIRLRTNDLSPIIDSDSVTIEGSGPMNVFTLFGKMIQVPIRFEGFHMMFEDADKILRLARQGIREMKVVMKSKTGELYRLFQPQLIEYPKSGRGGS